MENNKNWKDRYKNYQKIEKIEELRKLIDLIMWDDKNNLFFRGQADSDWKLNSSYTRKHENNKKQIIYNKKNNIFLFEEKIKYIKNKNIKKDKIEILSEMQHFGIKTLLIDFTSNFLHSLWFSFSEEFEIEPEYRAIFLLKYEGKISYKIKELDEKELVYNCPIINNRGLSQKSYFILDNGTWNEEKYIFKINISNNLKDKIIKLLINKKITASKIYPDLKGITLEFETESSASLFNEGNFYYANKNYKKAYEFLEKANKLEPNNINIHYNKGITLIKLKKYDEAIKYFDKVIELNPNDFNAFINKGVTLGKLKKYPKAIKCFDKAIELNPNNFEPYLWKGIILEEIKKYDEAINCYDKAIELKPNNANIYYNKAISLAKLKKYPEAIKCINKAIKLKPNNTNYKSYKNDLLKKIKK